MSMNTFGKLFTVTTWGESHGPAVGCVVDGVPAGVPLREDDIQPALDRRRPGRNSAVSPRNEADAVRILSGVYEGTTTGHPICLAVENANQRSKDYSDLARLFRPGQADYTYTVKSGIRDPRGGGRSSARETVGRVAAGAVARRVLGAFPETGDVAVRAGVVALGPVAADPAVWNEQAIDTNPLFCPDPDAVPAMVRELDRARENGDSLGGIVRVQATGVPAGLGEPVYDRLDGRLGGMFMGLNAVKGVEIGDGFAAAGQTGSVHNDAMRSRDGAPDFLTNHAGGVLGGISTGSPLVVRLAFKPTPSIAGQQRTVNADFADATVAVGGRHDPAVCIRAVPVVEGMMWCILADFFLLDRARRRG
ncbi:MAG: chorismate synthase [Planctomycetes bacterium]|nr:chorismate synthase [Planctomycetota bacterium]